MMRHFHHVHIHLQTRRSRRSDHHGLLFGLHISAKQRPRGSTIAHHSSEDGHAVVVGCGTRVQ